MGIPKYYMATMLLHGYDARYLDVKYLEYFECHLAFTRVSHDYASFSLTDICDLRRLATGCIIETY